MIGVPFTVTVAPVVELRNMPAGRVPEETDQEKGAVPLEREHGADQALEFSTGGPPGVRQFIASTAGATPVSMLMPPPSSATARSASPSPLKSAAARNDGALPASQGPAVPVWNVPSPWPASRVMAFDAESANRRSMLPSPLKSPGDGRVWLIARRITHRRRECAGAIVQQNCSVVRACRGDIRFPIAVEIGDNDSKRVIACRIRAAVPNAPSPLPAGR